MTVPSSAAVLPVVGLMLLVGYLFARLAARSRQPAVAGEMIAGIALGPSLLGLLPGDLTHVLFPPAIRPYLDLLAQLGLVLFMFGVGYHLDLGHVRTARRQITAVSVGSMVLPLALGTGMAALMYPWFDTSELRHGSMLVPVLFIGVAMSITAFPVLARILVEEGMHRTWIGNLALACAALEDVVAWCLLAGLVLLASASGFLPLALMVGEAVALMLVLVLVVRPLLAALLAPHRRKPIGSAGVFAVTVTGLLVSAWITDAIGLHAIFGAFAFGAIMPRDHVEALAPDVPRRIEEQSLLLLPIFFMVVGLSVNLGGLGWQGVVMTVAAVAVAIVGKFFGAAVPARLTGVSARESSVLGVLINARGLTELVILNVGLSLRVVDSRMFTAMVIMALVTTLMTGPLLRVLRRHRDPAQDLDVRQRSAASASGMATSPTTAMATNPPTAAPRSQPPET
ncbi:MAG: cation/H(+) antiporter [Nonomuraea sp.]|nr:cation/H(+) antiporter [Nonomuraea sp.]